MMSTSKVYGSKKISVLDEKKTCRPNSSYGKIRLKIENWGKHRLVPRLRDVYMGMQREGQFKYELRVFRANFTLCPCAKFQPGCASHKVQSSSFISLAGFFLARYRESVF